MAVNSFNAHVMIILDKLAFSMRLYRTVALLTWQKQLC